MTALDGVTLVDSDDAELVVLLDGNRQPCGTARKSAVHHASTPLHLAFSCWVVDGSGRTLLTRRAEVKRTWPGAWTNSFCGHPAPGESMAAAVHRRAHDELGAVVSEPLAVLPDFSYYAVMDDGTVENEVCPVYVATLLSEPAPNPGEVGDLQWVPFEGLESSLAETPSTYSPWMREQHAALLAAGWTPT